MSNLRGIKYSITGHRNVLFLLQEQFSKNKNLDFRKKEKQAKNKSRLALPENMITECLEKSIFNMRFSYSVKEFKQLKDFFMFTHTVLRCIYILS